MLSKLSQSNALLLRVLATSTPKYTGNVFSYTAMSSTKKGQSISVSDLNEVNQLEPHEPNKPNKLNLSFEDSKTAFKAKSSFELLRGYLVFQLCSISFLIENQKKVSRSILDCSCLCPHD